jgi:hypothetical protein
MKTLFLLLLSSSTMSLLANSWEMRVRYATTPPEGYYVFINPISIGVTHYGFDFFPKNAGSLFPDPLLVQKPTVTADFNSNDPNIDGDIYYGVYAVHFVDPQGQTIKRALIDWRDADYFNDAPLYEASYDFEVIYNLSNGSVTYQRTNGQSIYFSSATIEPSASIYEMAGKSQNASSFKNLQMSTAGAGQNVSFTVGSTNYTVPPSGSIYVAAGLGTVQVTVPN